jgi:hypothetical protein
VPLKPKVVLVVGPEVEDHLQAFVTRCLDEGVQLICVVGPRCALIEDLIDEWVIDISHRSGRELRVVITTSHPEEPLDEVIAFARAISDWPGTPEIVKL